MWIPSWGQGIASNQKTVGYPLTDLHLLHWWSPVFLTRFQVMLLVWGLLFENLCPGGAPKAPVWKALHSEGRGIVPESTEVKTYYVLEGGHGDSWTEILWNYTQGCPECPETMSGVGGRSTNSEQEDSVLNCWPAFKMHLGRHYVSQQAVQYLYSIFRLLSPK